jgi:DNA repair exonuclease SbcCD nuclease subunit
MAKIKTQTKKPIAAILTDTHLDEDNIETNKSVYRQARGIAKELGLEELFHGGDIFNSRKGQPQSVLNGFAEIIDEGEEDGIPIIAIPGNHDKTDYGSIVSFIEPYRKRPGFQLYNEASVLKIVGTTHIWGVPFFSDLLYIEQLKSITSKTFPKGVKHILLTHIGVNGAVMNNGVAISSGITNELFEKFDKVLIGHYHDPQHYSDKIQYIGASIQHNYGESPTKGLTILYDDGSTELRELDFPHFLNYEVDVAGLTLKDIADIKKEKEGSKDQIRITLVGAEKDVKSYDTTKLKELGVDVKRKQDKINQEEISSRIEAFTDGSLITMFEQFCEKNKLDLKQGLVYFSQALGFKVEEEEDV